MATQVSLLDGALASAGTLAIQTNGTTSAITISSAQVATFVNNPIMTGLTASRAVFTDGSKGLTSNAITGTGNVVMSASPTLTGTIDGAALTLSSSLTLSAGTANGVLYLNGSKVATSGSALTFDGTNFATTGSGTVKNLLLTGGTLPSAGTPSIALRSSDNVVYHQSGSANNIVLLDSSQNTMYSVASTAHIFAISNSEQMRLTSTGLGIGTTSPLANNQLTLYNASYSQFHMQNSTTGTGASDGFRVLVDGLNVTITNHEAGYMALETSNTERARIDSSGNLLVGTTNNNIGGTTTTGINATATGVLRAGCDGGASLLLNRISSDGTISFFQRQGTTVGTISVTGSATAYNTSSDYRLKENIQPMTGALAKVQALKPVTYKWKADGSDGEGFIAHELAEVVPQCVSGEKDAVDAEGKPVYQGIDTSFLVATLTAAIQEQQAIIEQLKARLDAANL
jgi:Chaperone of endosialidase